MLFRSQLYIYDSHTALQHQMNRNAGLNQHIMHLLQDLILENHRWAATFKNAFQVFERTCCREVSIQLTVNKNRDPRRFNLPTSDEVTVIVPGDGTQSSGHRDIVVHLQDGPLRRLSDVRNMDFSRFSNLYFHSFNSHFTSRLTTLTIDHDRCTFLFYTYLFFSYLFNLFYVHLSMYSSGLHFIRFTPCLIQSLILGP